MRPETITPGRARMSRRGLAWTVCAGIALIAGAMHARAQERPATVTSNDPRIALKPGLRDAGEAARNMELIATTPKPPGFFDPKMPSGEPVPPETPPPAPGNPKAPPTAVPPGTPPATPTGTPPAAPPATPPAAPPATPPAAPPAGQPAATPSSNPAGTPAPPPPAWGGLNFANSDLAFKGQHLYQGNFNGFNTYDIEDAKKPKLIASVVCPGGQGDMSVHGNLLFMSVEQTRGRIDCGTQGVAAPASAERFRGIRIFDVSDVRKPRQIAAVQTCRGSHTHTLVPDPNDKGTCTSTAPARARSGRRTSLPAAPGWTRRKIRTRRSSASMSSRCPSPLRRTRASSTVRASLPTRRPARSPGCGRAAITDRGRRRRRVTNQCHDITVFPELGLAAGACSGNGILLDISDPVHPVRLDQVVDKNFAYWHSATFNNDGTKVIFTDEWGGGTRPRCRATDQPTWGADAIFDIVDRKLQFASYYKLPAPQTEQENCVAHNGSLIPVPGRDIMAQAWYQGGVSVFDFTDSAHPVEIAFFDRGPIDAKQLITGGYWSTYWYNGHIYGAEIARGVDVFKLTPSEYLSQNEIDAANAVRFDRVQRAAAAEDRLAGDVDGGARVPRSAHAQQGHPAGARPRRESRARARRQTQDRTGAERPRCARAARRAGDAARERCRRRGRPRRRSPAIARSHHQRPHRETAMRAPRKGGTQGKAQRRASDLGFLCVLLLAAASSLGACSHAAQERSAPSSQNKEAQAVWTATLETSGGFAGTGTGSVTVASTGNATVTEPVRPGGTGRPPDPDKCRYTVPPDILKRLAEAVSKARLSTWAGSYVRAENPRGCCDQFRVHPVARSGKAGERGVDCAHVLVRRQHCAPAGRSPGCVRGRHTREGKRASGLWWLEGRLRGSRSHHRQVVCQNSASYLPGGLSWQFALSRSGFPP